MSSDFTTADSPAGDLLAALVYFDRPVVSYGLDENGAEVTVMAQAQDISAYMGYARAHGLVKPVAAPKVVEAPPEVSPAKANVFDTVSLGELMSTSMKNIRAWIAAQAAELTPADVESMLAWEEGQKKP